MTIHTGYGITYRGSKNKHIKWLFEHIPHGRRFIDLFGGGFAVSHAAVESGRYEKVIYSDLNTDIVELMRQARDGMYDIGVFQPYWVTPEMFKIERDKTCNKDHYALRCFSFGCDGESYFCSTKDNRYRIFRGIFDYIVTGYITYELASIWRTFNIYDTKDMNWSERMSYFVDFKRLPYPWNPRVLTNLRRIIMTGKAARNAEILLRDYRDYDYQPGDVVYCDIPYRKTRHDGYCKDAFDHEAFYAWARRVPCFVSEYSMPDDFVCISEKKVTLNNNNYGVKKNATERLFKSPAYIEAEKWL